VVADQVVPREWTPPAAPRSRSAIAPAAAKELAVDAAQQSTLLNGKRKHQGWHVVATPDVAPGATATKAKAAKVPANKPQKKPVAKKVTAKKPAAKMASLTANNVDGRGVLLSRGRTQALAERFGGETGLRPPLPKVSHVFF
jgi:hypothetical protein